MSTFCNREPFDFKSRSRLRRLPPCELGGELTLCCCALAGAFAPKPDALHPLLESVAMRFCDFEVGRVEALGQPVRDRLEEGHGICGTALIAQQPGEARGVGQFPGEGTLPARPIERLPEVILGHHRGSGRALQQNQLAFDAQQLGNRPAFFGALRACVRLLDHDEPVGNLPGTARGFRPSSRSSITVCQPREVYSSRAGHGVCWQWRSGARNSPPVALAP